MLTDSAGLNPAVKDSESSKNQEDTLLSEKPGIPREAARAHLKTQCLTSYTESLGSEPQERRPFDHYFCP
jgi:hypothetical protein